jgi:hypothetical protein
MVSLQVIGKGEEITIREFTGLSSVFPIVYNHRDSQMQSALLQGMPSVTAGGDQVTIDFQTLYGFYPSMQAGEDDQSPRPMYGLKGKALEDRNRGDLERSAFLYGSDIYRACFDLLGKMRLTGSDSKYYEITETQDQVKYVEVVIDTLKAMRDRVINDIENQVVLHDMLKESRGHYRWIGLRTGAGKRGIPLTTPMKLPRMIGGQRDLFLTTSTMPTNGGSFIRPRADDVAHTVVSGMIHGFEGRTEWDEYTAIRASLFHHTYGDSVSPELIFSAAARAGLYPRLGTKLAVGKTGGHFAWRHLGALALAYDFFRTYYIPSFGQPVGSVQYAFSGGGVAQILENKIKRYISSAAVNLSDDINPSPGGLVFLPSTNAPDQKYSFSFVRRQPDAYTKPSLRCTTIAPYDGETLSTKFQSNPTRITKELFMIQEPDDRREDAWRPVLIDSVPSLVSYRKYIAAGLYVTRMKIKDKVDPKAVPPSELVSSLLMGWNPAFEPKAMLFTNTPVGSGVRDIFNLDFSETIQGVSYNE